MKNKISFVAMVVILIMTTSSFAFRCGEYGNYLATSDMTQKKIFSDCGTPRSKKRISEYSQKKRCHMVEEWIYEIKAWGQTQVHAIRFDKNGIAVEEEWLGPLK